MTINKALKHAFDLLVGNVNTPSLDASLLLCELLKMDKTTLIINGNDELPKKKYDKYKRLIKRRLNGECIAYITGHKEFYGLDFMVNKKVLVPRPETEILVEKSIDLLKTKNQNTNKSILDLCTGSGAIAIAIKHTMPELEVWASDISKKALAIARKNGVRLKLEIKFIKSDLFSNIKGCFDIIITNPPYICSKKISSLALEVQREPRIALDGGLDGLDLIHRIIKDSVRHLNPGGYILMEADSGQIPVIEKILLNAGFRDCVSYKDLGNQLRVIAASYG